MGRRVVTLACGRQDSSASIEIRKESTETMSKLTISNRYYKDRPAGVVLMSGLPLPKDENGIVRNIDFVNCEFHPNCRSIPFVNCTFESCDGADQLRGN
jgi:hypothetical protein